MKLINMEWLAISWSENKWQLQREVLSPVNSLSQLWELIAPSLAKTQVQKLFDKFVEGLSWVLHITLHDSLT